MKIKKGSRVQYVGDPRVAIWQGRKGTVLSLIGVSKGSPQLVSVRWDVEGGRLECTHSSVEPKDIEIL